MVDDEEEELDEGPLNIMGVISLVGAIAACLIACMSFQKIPAFRHDPPSDPDSQANWQKGTYPDEESAMKMAPEYNPFHEPTYEADRFENKFEDIKTAEASIPALVES